MRIRSQGPRFSSFLLITTLLAANVAIGDAVTAQNAFDSGNTAFRSKDYSSALANYNQAMLNGKDGPRLFYNMGLTHYRLGQYSQATSAFMESASDDTMAALSYYQLGVLAEKAGDSNAAADWFRRSRDRAESPKLRQLSMNALETVGVSATGFESEFSASFGNDSNAFRAPSDPYIDLSRTPPVPVVPVVHSGTYVPIRIRASYKNPLSDQSQFVASYRHRGNYYTDAALENANVTDHILSIGIERERKFAFAVILGDHAETNYDRDDGLDRFDDGSSIADRFDYRSIGAEFEVQNRVGRYRYELDGGLTRREYEDVPTASPYDMTTYWFGGAFKIPLAKKSRVKIGYKFHVRDYDERRSRDASGDASNQNPALAYQYNSIEAGVRQRFSDSFAAELIYFYTVREDKFVGYNDYTRHKIRLKMSFDPSDKFSASIRVDTRDQVYENAFAFDQPGQPRKEYQEFQVSARALYRLTDRLSLRADVKQETIESSDPRGEYDRTRTSIGVSWEF